MADVGRSTPLSAVADVLAEAVVTANLLISMVVNSSVNEQRKARGDNRADNHRLDPGRYESARAGLAIPAGDAEGNQRRQQAQGPVQPADAGCDRPALSLGHGPRDRRRDGWLGLGYGCGGIGRSN